MLKEFAADTRADFDRQFNQIIAAVPAFVSMYHQSPEYVCDCDRFCGWWACILTASYRGTKSAFRRAVRRYELAALFGTALTTATSPPTKQGNIKLWKFGTSGLLFGYRCIAGDTQAHKVFTDTGFYDIQLQNHRGAHRIVKEALKAHREIPPFANS